MSTTPAFLTVRAPDLRAAVAAALDRAGVPPDIAAIEADIMVEADLCGVPSHGVNMLPRLLVGLREGRAQAAPTLRTLRDRGAMCVIDTGNGPGRWASAMAMDHAVVRARTFGVGVCLAVQTTHWGRAHAYAARAARQGMVGVCTTNAIPTLKPEGAAQALLGNNPLAIGIPCRDGGDPVVLDIAMTQAALGKVMTWRREGREIPSDWGFDAAGQATSDATAVLASGLLAPMGGHKGTGLAFMLELLTAGLAGAGFGHEIVARDASGLDPGTTKLFLALDPEAFGARDTLAGRVDELSAWLHDGTGGGPLPGERGWQARAQHLHDGVPLHPAIVAALAAEGVSVVDR